MDGYWHNNTTAGSALLRKPILLLFITVMIMTLFKELIFKGRNYAHTKNMYTLLDR